MRITGGTLGGRLLVAPPGQGTRPTTDKVRQAIFNLLGPPPEGAEVLDLFAGSGALGLEAISRGAVRATLVERARPALVALSKNVAALGLAAQVRVATGDVRAVLPRLVGPFRWVFLDPPYAAGVLDEVLAAFSPAQLAPGAVVVAEHDRRSPPAPSCGILALRDRRRYGETEVSLYVRAAPEAPA